VKKRAQLIVTNNDIKKARDCYTALRDLVIQNSGGWDDADTRRKVDGLCSAASAEGHDGES